MPPLGKKWLPKGVIKPFKYKSLSKILMNINWLKKISNKNQHDAFTDLNRLKNHLYLCFRRATDHHSADGFIVIQQLNLLGKLIKQSELTILNSDLRDPKLTILRDESLLLSAYARKVEIDDKGEEIRTSQNTYWLSRDGIHWQHQGFFAAHFHWCWRLSLKDDQIFGLAYERRTENLYLYEGPGLDNFKSKSKPILSKEEHGLGYPNESDLCFVSETDAIAIVRRDADTYSTQFGKSIAPFDDWQWQDLPIYLASPRVLSLNEKEVLIAARYEHTHLTQLKDEQEPLIQYFGSGNEKLPYSDEELKTGLFKLNLRNNELSFLLPLPSADDNGYPGLVLNDTGFWLSYYSTPQAGQTQVYLCYVSAKQY
ncbi:MAG: hypothetical protein ACI9O6_001970 [Glaciecola sp.]